jgi:hypothetical protein
MDDHGNTLGMPDDLHLGYIGALNLGQLIDALADGQVLMESLGVFPGLHIPFGAPILVDPDT